MLSRRSKNGFGNAVNANHGAKIRARKRAKRRFRFLPGTRFVFELQKCPFTPAPTVPILDGRVDAKSRHRRTDLGVSPNKLVCLLSQQIAVGIKIKVRDGRRKRETRKTCVLPRQNGISREADRVKKFFAASEKVPILRVSASVA